MKKTILHLSIILLSAHAIIAQEADTLKQSYSNSVDKMLADKPGLSIGGYGEVHFNQPMTKNTKELGTLDVHRVVMFMGYNFSHKTQFVTEVEFEYAKEVWIEQAFLQHKLHKYLNFRAGLMLIPMGIINEYHEPTTFNGVERPIIDNKIAPSTWREVGVGFSGNIQPAKLKYQLYVIGGLNGYDSKGIFTGSQPLREGRQKGSKTYTTSPNYTGKIDFYGIKNLSIGVSYYGGESQSQLYKKLHSDSLRLKERADSSVVGINMFGADLRYTIKGLHLVGQFYYTALSNTEKYNTFTRINKKNNDLGKSIIGYYGEIGYNVMQPFTECKTAVIPFFRYEKYNLHHSVDQLVSVNDKYNVQVLTTGITVKLAKGAVLKTDVQLIKSKADSEYSKTFNAGIGVMF